jgi:TatD DNase family protein
MPFLLDTHCHVDQYLDPAGVVRGLEGSGVVAIAMTNAPSAFERLRRRFSGERRLRYALGAHPLHVAAFPEIEWQLFERLLGETTYVGEVGLDFSRDGISTRAAQEQAFGRVLRAVAGRGKVLSVHSRRAESTVLEMLEQHRSPPVIFHWFSGSLSVLARALEAGHYCSFNPAMVASANGRRVIGLVPPERTLLETDGPFVRFESREAVPGDVQAVCRYLAALWEVDTRDVIDQTSRNFMTLVAQARKATDAHACTQ